MSKTLVVLWLGAQTAFSPAKPHLDSWARARWLSLAQPTTSQGRPVNYDAELVERIEQTLEQARIASASGNESTALSHLRDVEASLKDHPELPQAAWLLAERHHVEAELWRRNEDGATKAAELVGKARALEGTRAESFVADPDRARPLPGAQVSVEIVGHGEGDDLFIDGVTRPARTSLVIGEHHVRVVREQRLLWAGWVSVDAKTATLALPVPPPAPCSSDDLAFVALRGGRATASGALCPRWAAARPTAGGVEVALCSGESCGAFLPWRASAGESYRNPPQPRRQGASPVWWIVGAGVGAVIVTGAVLIHAGTFDDPAPSRRRFVYSGPR